MKQNWEENSVAYFFREESYEKPDGTKSIKLVMRKNSIKIEIKKISMKLNLVLVICFTIFSVNAQEIDDLRLAENLKYENHEGLFTYSLVANKSIYISIRPISTDFSHIVSKRLIEKKCIPIFHYGGGSEIRKPYAWSKDSTNIYTIDYFKSSSGRMNTYISYRSFETLDSIEIKKLPADFEIYKELIWINPMSDYYMSFFKKRPLPTKQDVEKTYKILSFDIYSSDSNKIRFYMRDESVFYEWEYQIAVSSSEIKWTELAAYASPNVDTLYSPFKYSDSYTGTKTHHNAITDTLFFDGHFKVLEQNGEKYIINRQHGIIYHMGANAIIPIGRVMVTDDYPKIQGKSLFIEDRDNNRIIFFAPVKWTKNNLPKPKVYFMKPKEMKEYFKYVMN